MEVAFIRVFWSGRVTLAHVARHFSVDCVAAHNTGMHARTLRAKWLNGRGTTSPGQAHTAWAT